MKKLRGAVIGCGMIAEFHLRGWARLSAVEIVALVDPNPAAAAHCRDRFAPTARLYPDLESMLAAETPDFVEILTPPALHREHCLRTREANVHVICQKPLCDGLEAAQTLVADFSDYGKMFSVHENHIYRPWFRHVRELHRAGTLGPLRLIRLEQNDPVAPPQSFNRESARGVLLEYGVHLADMVRVLLGVPEHVSAQVHHINPHVRGESLAQVTFTYPQATAVLDFAWKNGGGVQGGALFVGERGEACYEGSLNRGTTARFRVVANLQTVVDETRETVDDYVESFYSFQRDFVDAVQKGLPGPQPAAENLQTLAMIFAAYRSAETNQSVSFSDFMSGK